MTCKLKVRAQGRDWRSHVALLVIAENGSSYCSSLTMTECEPDDAIMQPTIELSIPNAQLLMDDLWQAGIRPTEGAGSAGAMAATEKHLEDMRSLTFRTLSALLPPEETVVSGEPARFQH